MKERSILFSAPMVKAIMAGTKTQTRRVIKIEMGDTWHEGYPYRINVKASRPGQARQYDAIPCPYGVSGDVLKVKEAAWMWCERRPNGQTPRGRQKWHYVPMREARIFYCADHPDKPSVGVVSPETGTAWGWRKKIGRFLPVWAVRTRLKIKSMRVERVKEISKEDAVKEGVDWQACPSYIAPEHFDRMTKGMPVHTVDYVGGFKSLWNSINAKRAPWESNPRVWVVEFEKVNSGIKI